MTPKNLREQQDKIITMYDEGKSIREIARTFGDVNKNSISRLIREKREIRPRSIPDDELDVMYKKYLSGHSIKDIAKTVSWSALTITRAFKKNYGIMMKKTKPLKYEHLLSEFIEMYDEGYSMAHIAEKCQVSKQTVSNYLAMDQKEVRSYRETSKKYDINEDFFNVQTPENINVLGRLAYYATFFDTISGKEMRLVSGSDRGEKLKQIVQYFSSNDHVLVIPRDRSMVVIKNLKLINDILLLGVADGKLTIEQELIDYFIRGYLTEASTLSKNRLKIKTRNRLWLVELIRQWLKSKELPEGSQDESGAILIQKKSEITRVVEQIQEINGESNEYC